MGRIMTRQQVDDTRAALYNAVRIAKKYDDEDLMYYLRKALNSLAT